MKNQGGDSNRNQPTSHGPLAGLVAGLTFLTALGVAGGTSPSDLVTTGAIDAHSGAGDSSAPIVTPDGRFVVFLSSAGNLVTNDDNGTTDVFLRDRELGRTYLVSVGAAGRNANSASTSPSVSSNGQFVVFQSRASNLATGATNGWENLFVRDMISATMALVSAATNGNAGDHSSFNPQITPDGKFIVFESLADNLVGNDSNRLSDVFVSDLAGGSTALVSVNAAGDGTSPGYSINPSITPDGRFVVFQSTAAGLVTNDFNTTSDVFLRDLVAGTTTLISAGVNGNAAGSSQNASVSDNGRYAAFESTSGNLVAGDSDTLNDIFVRDLMTGTTRLASARSEFNVSSNAPSGPVLSRDGRFVAFQTGAAPPTSVVLNGQIYLWDAQSGTNLLVSAGLDGLTPAAGVSHSPLISGDNRSITFLSNATNLVAGATNGTFQVYQHDLVSGVTTLLSVSSLGNASNLDCFSASASDDARVVAFDSRADNLSADDGNYAGDVFVRNLLNDSIELISSAAAGLASATPLGLSSVVPGALSADGRFVVFSSAAPNLLPNDANATHDVFVRDLWNGTNALVSVNTNGASGNGTSRNPSISADGRFVAFTSQATDLTSGVSNQVGNIFLRDLQSGTTLLVSANASGRGGMGASINPSLNADASRITYESLASDLATNDLNTTTDIFLYDRTLGTNFLVSVGTNGVSGGAASRSPILSRDGRFVVFLSDAKNLVTTSTFGPSQLFARDLANQETFLVSVDSKTVRNQIGLASQVLSQDGRFLVYTAPTNVYAFDLVERTNTVIYSGGFNASISANGRFVAFEKPLYATGLLTSLTNSAVVVWDRELGAEMLASANAENTGTGNAYSRSPLLGADGRFVVFKSQASNLGSSDTNGVTDVFVRDLVLGQTLSISLNRSGTATGNLLSGNPIIGGDGRTVLFESFASDLAANDFNESRDLFVLRLGAVDSDRDGMDDDWEMAYFETLTRDGTGDFDADGLSDLAEFKAGTNPKNDGSLLRALMVASLSDGRTTVFWTAIPGRTYQVQFKDSPADANWMNLPGTVIAGDTTASKADSTAAGSFNRFYRVELISP